MSSNSKAKNTTSGAEETINDTIYVTVAGDYYNSEMYSEETQVISEIFDEVIPVFNAVPKVVNIATALSVGGELEILAEDTDFVQSFIDATNFNEEKALMARDLILGKSLLVEIKQPVDEEDPDSYGEFGYKISYYTPDDYEIISVGNEIIYAKLTGVKYVFDEDSEEFEEEEIEKFYIKTSDKAYSYITDSDGERSGELEYPSGKLPLVEMNTTYDMKQLFYSVDRHNEFEAYIRNIFYLAGEPIVVGTGIDKINTKDSELITTDRYKKQRYLYTKSKDAQLQLLEIQGNSAKTMIEKQAEIVKNIIKDYPEYSISEVLSGSNVSEETTRIRLTEVLSRITEVRDTLEKGFNDIIEVIAYLNGLEIEEKYVTLGNMLDTNVSEVITTVVTALENNLISRRSAMYQIKDIFIAKDVNKEAERIINDDTGVEEYISSKSVSTDTQENVVVEEVIETDEDVQE